MLHRATVDGAAPLKVCALGPPPPSVDAAPAFAVLCATANDASLADGEVLDEDAEPSTFPPLGCANWPLDCLHDARLGGVPPAASSNRHEVRVVSGLGFRTTQRCVLHRGERGVSCSLAYLSRALKDDEPPQRRGAAPRPARRSDRKAYVLVGTVYATGLGEDAPTRGRLLLFEISYAPVRKARPDSRRRGKRCGFLPILRLAYAKDLKGAAAGVAQLQEHIVVAVSNRLEVYELRDDGGLLQIAMYHAQVQTWAAQF